MIAKRISVLSLPWSTRRRRRSWGGPTRRQVLQTLGLEERRSKPSIVATGLGLLSAGALLGAGLMLVFAPGRLLNQHDRGS